MKCSLWPDSIKTRVTLSALGVFLVSLWILAFLTTRILERDISQLVADAQASATNQMALLIDRELHSRLAALEHKAALISSDLMADSAALQNSLDQRTLLKSFFNVSVLAVNREGIGIADSPYLQERIGINYRERVDAFAVALDEGQASIGSPLRGLSTGQPLIPLAVPIRNHAGEVIGALGGAIDLSKPNFFDDLTAQAYGRTGYYSVISKSRRMVVTSSNPDLIMAELPPPGVSLALDRAIRGEEGSERYTTTQGIDSLATVRSLEVTDWFIATITPISEAYLPIRDMQRRMTLITLVVTVLVGSIVWWILQRQLKPLLSTVDVLEQMTQQDQTWTNLPLTGGNEINRLIGSFNRLLHVVIEREQENKRFKTMADNAVYGRAMADMEGNLVYINRFFAEIHGYTPAELLGKNLSIFHTSSQLEHVDNLVSQLRQDGYFSPSEVWHVHRHGTEFPMLMSAITLKDDDGNPQYLTTSAVDITDQKRVQLALELKNTELEQFVYGVSHDLKSPLVTVRVFVSILKQDLLKGHYQQINDDLNYIDKAADKIGQLLDALLQYSRIGRSDAPAQPLSAEQSLQDCLAALAGILPQHQVQVLTSELPQLLYGDPLHFGQIWQNLIENAVKYRGDQLHPRIEIGARHEGPDVVFYVRDNGMGIAPEHRERIFNLFSQLNPESDGSGLGLALVKKIVTNYQGRIWVESEGAGKGSCFMLTLPGALIHVKEAT